jgi:hypothetical protein
MPVLVVQESQPWLPETRRTIVPPLLVYTTVTRMLWCCFDSRLEAPRFTRRVAARVFEFLHTVTPPTRDQRCPHRRVYHNILLRQILTL